MRRYSSAESARGRAPCLQNSSTISGHLALSPSLAANMDTADRYGIRTVPARSNLREIRTARYLILRNSWCVVLTPARLASTRATRSQVSKL